MTAPIPLTVIRWQCPHCRRGWSAKTRATAHIARCWHNPDTHGCKTCKHFEPFQPTGCYEPESPEDCRAGIDLTRSAEDGGGTMPRINCELWEAS